MLRRHPLSGPASRTAGIDVRLTRCLSECVWPMAQGKNSEVARRRRAQSEPSAHAQRALAAFGSFRGSVQGYRHPQAPCLSQLRSAQQGGIPVSPAKFAAAGPPACAGCRPDPLWHRSAATLAVAWIRMSGSDPIDVHESQTPLADVTHKKMYSVRRRRATAERCNELAANRGPSGVGASSGCHAGLHVGDSEGWVAE